jgi:uncharacterized membrane protein
MLHILATSPWIILVPAIVVLVIAFGAKTFIVDARSALTKWVGDKIAVVTGRPRVEISGLAGGMKAVGSFVRGNWLLMFVVGNLIIAILLVLILTRVEHSHHPTPPASISPSSTHS